ncbi:hypothetical protein [Variovorax sp. dw_954]|uniref:hypothetical protein n=1 Tax=Variovorax sp. dw_954 TaxID=2720078 RepID=UPI001BD5E621|nr:hypothetical protein [Variovorax sp. dw_954]
MNPVPAPLLQPARRDRWQPFAVMTDVVSQGPFPVARLQPGRYDVQATLAGRTLNQRITVRGNAPTHSVFVWPAGTDVSVGS